MFHIKFLGVPLGSRISQYRSGNFCLTKPEHFLRGLPLHTGSFHRLISQYKKGFTCKAYWFYWLSQPLSYHLDECNTGQIPKMLCNADSRCGIHSDSAVTRFGFQQMFQHLRAIRHDRARSLFLKSVVQTSRSFRTLRKGSNFQRWRNLQLA